MVDPVDFALVFLRAADGRFGPIGRDISFDTMGLGNMLLNAIEAE
jgi:hypothetical protein